MLLRVQFGCPSRVVFREMPPFQGSDFPGLDRLPARWNKLVNGVVRSGEGCYLDIRILSTKIPVLVKKGRKSLVLHPELHCNSYVLAIPMHFEPVECLPNRHQKITHASHFGLGERVRPKMKFMPRAKSVNTLGVAKPHRSFGDTVRTDADPRIERSEIRIENRRAPHQDDVRMFDDMGSTLKMRTKVDRHRRSGKFLRSGT